MMRCARCVARSRGKGSTLWWRSTYASTSTRSRIMSCARSSTSESRTGVIRRVIDKWLKAGVLEDGLLRLTREGTPQGGVISPMLSNIYLHHVLDEWFENEVKPRMAGPCTLVRFA